MKTSIMKRTALITALMLFVALGASQTSSNIDINLKNTEPTPLQTSEYADVWLEVENTGSAEAQDFEVEFREKYPFATDDRKNWSISSLEPGETYQIHLQARVDGNAVQGENQLEFMVERTDFSYIEKVPVEVRSDRNVLAVEQIDFPENVAPGSSSEMSLKLRNLADSQLKNIEVSLDSTDLPFATSDASTKNLESISSDAVWLNYSLNVDEGAENGVYKLPIDVSFENEAGTEFTQETTTGVTVGGTPDLEVGLNTEEALTDGTREITLRLVNQGHGSADFVSLQLRENDQVEVIGSNDVYIGSMDPDDFQTASFQVNIDSDQESVDAPLQLPVEVTYTDREGEQSEVQDVEAEVYSQQELRQYGLGGGNNLLPVAVVALVLVVGGVVYWRRKRK